MKKILYVTLNPVFQKTNLSSLPVTLNRYLITNSAGQDSILSLFIALHSLKNIKIEIIYCNHFWQVKNFITSKVLFQVTYLLAIPYSASLPEKTVLTENQSRQWRKKIFYRLAELENNPILVTGHTQTDIIEKNFNNFLRGTSLTGFSQTNLFYSKKVIEIFFPETVYKNPSFVTLQKQTSLSKKLFFQKNNIKKYLTKKKINFNLKTPVPKKLFKFWNPQKKYIITLTKRQPKKIFFDIVDGQFKINANSLVKFFLTTNFNFFIVIKSLTTAYSIKNFLTPQIFTSMFDSKKLFFENHFLGKNLNKKHSYSYCFSKKFFSIENIVIKPLNNLERSSISRLVKFYNFPVLIDLTNFSVKFSRNKIRHQFLPFTRFLLKKNNERLLTKFFQILSLENQFKIETTNKLHFTYKNWIVKVKNYFFLNFCFSQKKVDRDKKIFEKKLKFLFKKYKEHNNLVNKLFFQYKNINLNFSQNTKLKRFFERK